MAKESTYILMWLINNQPEINQDDCVLGFFLGQFEMSTYMDISEKACVKGSSLGG